MQQKYLQTGSVLFAKKLLAWFKQHKRDLPWRKESSRYRILVTEKLLQQTDVAHVVKIYENFFDYYPTVEALAGADQEQIANTIKSLGFWRIRSRDLKLLANQLLDQYCGAIPSDRQELLQLFGVGDYITSAVLCFGFGKKEAVVDVNVRRVAKRLFFGNQSYQQLKIFRAMKFPSLSIGILILQRYGMLLILRGIQIHQLYIQVWHLNLLDQKKVLSHIKC